MAKKKVEIEVCDFCLEGEEKEDDYLIECNGCGKLMCPEHRVDEDWAIPDTPLCNNCHTKVWKNMQQFIEKLGKENK